MLSIKLLQEIWIPGWQPSLNLCMATQIINMDWSSTTVCSMLHFFKLLVLKCIMHLHL